MKNIKTEVKFSEDEMEELYVAGWLHDFGKVSTPEYIMNKSTKLEGFYDKIEFVKMKLEILKRDKIINFYNENFDFQSIDKKLLHEIAQIEDDIKFLENCNIGGEFMESNLKNRVVNISEEKINIKGEQINLLSKEEVNYLNISKGTLSEEDRKIMNQHVELTYELLDKLPYPKHLSKVPFFAGCHHEKINGQGLLVSKTLITF